VITALFVILAGCAGEEFKVKDGILNAAFKIKDAGEVAFYRSSNGFAPVNAEKIKGKWTVSVPSEEKFTYFLKVDGKEYLPECSMKQTDDFGGKICIYEEKAE
jgi:hypothetical protein